MGVKEVDTVSADIFGEGPITPALIFDKKPLVRQARKRHSTMAMTASSYRRGATQSVTNFQAVYCASC